MGGALRVRGLAARAGVIHGFDQQRVGARGGAGAVLADGGVSGGERGRALAEALAVGFADRRAQHLQGVCASAWRKADHLNAEPAEQRAERWRFGRFIMAATIVPLFCGAAPAVRAEIFGVVYPLGRHSARTLGAHG